MTAAAIVNISFMGTIQCNVVQLQHKQINGNCEGEKKNGMVDISSLEKFFYSQYIISMSQPNMYVNNEEENKSFPSYTRLCT